MDTSIARYLRLGVVGVSCVMALAACSSSATSTSHQSAATFASTPTTLVGAPRSPTELPTARAALWACKYVTALENLANDGTGSKLAAQSTFDAARIAVFASAVPAADSPYAPLHNDAQDLLSYANSSVNWSEPSGFFDSQSLRKVSDDCRTLATTAIPVGQ
jgi:hypothetical protein